MLPKTRSRNIQSGAVVQVPSDVIVVISNPRKWVFTWEYSFWSEPLGDFGCLPFHRRFTLVQLNFDVLLLSIIFCLQSRLRQLYSRSIRCRKLRTAISAAKSDHFPAFVIRSFWSLFPNLFSCHSWLGKGRGIWLWTRMKSECTELFHHMDYCYRIYYIYFYIKTCMSIFWLGLNKRNLKKSLCWTFSERNPLKKLKLRKQKLKLERNFWKIRINAGIEKLISKTEN